MTNLHRMGKRREETGSILEIGRAPTEGERAAHLRLFTVAITLVAARRGDAFPVEGAAWDEFIAAAKKACPDLSVVRPGGEWPADLVDRVAVLVAEDGSAMVLMTEMLTPGAFPECDDMAAEESDAAPELECLTVHKDGSSCLGIGDTTTKLLALVPKRQMTD